MKLKFYNRDRRTTFMYGETMWKNKIPNLDFNQNMDKCLLLLQPTAHIRPIIPITTLC